MVFFFIIFTLMETAERQNNIKKPAKRCSKKRRVQREKQSMGGETSRNTLLERVEVIGSRKYR